MPPDYVSTVTVLSNITWVDAPSYAEVVAAYPDKARTKGLSGRATLDCVFAKDGRVKDCRALQQQPSGAGFGRAAILLSSRFKGPDLLPEGRVTRGMHVQIPFVFSIEMLDPSKRVVGTPYWVALPDLSQVMSIFPKAALQAGVQDGRAALDCEVLVAGKVGGCAVVREFPRNLGFGDAVLALTPTFQLSVWTDEGLPTVGGRAVIPVRFKSPDTAEPPKP
jgi:TonB family protein